MGCILDQPVALPDSLADQAELTVLQVTDPAVGHVRGGRGGARAEVAAVNKQHVDAVEGQVAEGVVPDHTPLHRSLQNRRSGTGAFGHAPNLARPVG